MGRYTIKQLVIIVEQFFKNNESLVVTVRKFRTKNGRNIDLTLTTVKRVV